MSENTKETLGLTNYEIAKLIDNLSDNDFYEVMLEIGKMNKLQGKEIQNTAEFIKWLDNVLREIANLPEKGNIKPFGDECEINVPDEPVNCSSLNYFDKLEYDCWNLIQNYANKFGIKIEGEISFDLAKEIQDCIIRQFENAGVKFKF